MSIFFTCLLVGVSLSMDAFSLALIYGTYGLDRRSIVLLAVIVGLFHFFMPLFGLGLGGFINNYLNFDIGIVVSIIFCIIGIEMFISSIKNEDVSVMVSLIGFVLFGLSVSIDSFTTGIGLSFISDNYLLCSCCFMCVSGLFTYFGLNIGNKISEKVGNISTMIGSFIMLFLALYYFVKI